MMLIMIFTTLIGLLIIAFFMCKFFFQRRRFSRDHGSRNVSRSQGISSLLLLCIVRYVVQVDFVS